MNAIERRLTRVAEALQCCPTHGCVLDCANQWQWTATPAEIEEAEALLARLERYQPLLRDTGYHCRRCGEPLWCPQCCTPYVPEQEPPRDLWTPEEEARLDALMPLFIKLPEHP
jgi:hypothetical protein